MKNIDLWRLLLAFPMIGIGLPDVVLALSEPGYRIPFMHWMILLALAGLQILLTVFRRDGSDGSSGTSLA